MEAATSFLGQTGPDSQVGTIWCLFRHTNKRTWWFNQLVLLFSCHIYILKDQHITPSFFSLLSNIYSLLYICVCAYTYICIYIIHFSIDNYIQVMKHRIYSFPPRAEEKQIHTQFTEEVPLRAQPDRSRGPPGGEGAGSS